LNIFVQYGVNSWTYHWIVARHLPSKGNATEEKANIYPWL